MFSTPEESRSGAMSPFTSATATYSLPKKAQ
jgi:hypothetical protein